MRYESGLEILNGKPAEDAFNYATYAENGHLLRSSSIYFHNSAGQPIGSLCINTDITDTTYFEKMLREYNNTHDYENREDASPKEVFMPDVHELLNRLIDQCIQKYGKPPKLLTKEEKIQFIADLDMKGAFVITKASDRVYSLLGISRYTFYTYLEQGRKMRGESRTPVE